MKKRYKIIIWGSVAVVGVIVVRVALSVIWIFVWIERDVRASDRERAQLLYMTDHTNLLAACRIVMTNRHAFAKDEGWHGPDNTEESLISPRDTNLPTIIRQLHPSYVIARDESVTIELHGGLDHYGVNAVSQRKEESEAESLHERIQLVPGLFYYDEGLTYNRERWIKRLKEIRPNHASDAIGVEATPQPQR